MKRKTAKDWLGRSLGKLAGMVPVTPALKVGDQCRRLVSKVRGRYQYFGVANQGAQP